MAVPEPAGQGIISSQRTPDWPEGGDRDPGGALGAIWGLGFSAGDSRGPWTMLETEPGSPSSHP